ncbi:MAG: polysaccharide deacetylase family protein [Clostridia bacterium]|nr:polysaccharide deacetylase family protein [Clostridia bacterium]
MKLIIIKKKTVAVISVLLTVLIAFVIGFTTFTSAQAEPRRTPIYCVKTDEKKVAISFDACWGADKTLEILSMLTKFDIVANYFCVSSWAEKYADKLKTLSDSGRVEVGTHSVTHSHMSKMSKSQIENELTQSSNIIKNITGKQVTLFRPPYGEYNNTLIDVSFSLGLYPIQWDIDSLDWKNLSANEMATRILSRAKEGSIILMHNDGKHTVEALPLIIMGLKNKGYTFVFISDLIYKDNYTIDSTGRQIPTE